MPSRRLLYRRGLPMESAMGFACCDPAARVTTARPSAISFASKPIRRAMGTSFVFAFAMNPH